MANYTRKIVYREQLDITSYIGVEDDFSIYTERYPLLEPKWLEHNSAYQEVAFGNVSLVSSGYNFFDYDNIKSYFNFDIKPDELWLQFKSSTGEYYDTVAVIGVSGDLGINAILPYTEDQVFYLGYDNRIKISDEYGFTLNLGEAEYSGDTTFMVSFDDANPNLYVDGHLDYFLNESLYTGEIVLRPLANDKLRVFNTSTSYYPINMNESFYREQILTSGESNQVVIDDFGNYLLIDYSGFNVGVDIPLYISIDPKYANIYRRDSRSSNERTQLVREVDYTIDCYNGKISFYNTLTWDEDSVVWIENYMYDETYYKYINSARLEIGDDESENYFNSHKRMRDLFHKALTKILFWVPLDYEIEDNYITPILDNDMISFVSGMCKILSFKSQLGKNMGRAIKVKDGDTSLDLTGGLNPSRAIIADELKQFEKELRARIDNYCVSKGYYDMKPQGSQIPTGSLNAWPNM